MLKGRPRGSDVLLNERRGASLPYLRGLLVIFVMLISVNVRAEPPATAPAEPSSVGPVARRVLIVSVDGLRPDLLIRAKTPTLQALIDRGSFTFWAVTTDLAVTLPSHVSMLTGVKPARHGILWNALPTPGEPLYPIVPTLFDLADAQGMSTMLVAGKMKFFALNRGGAMANVFIPRSDTTSDDVVAAAAIERLRAHRPRVAVVHFPGVDNTGHASGWGSPEQIAAVEAVDAHIGSMLKELDALGVLNETAVLVTADHGGQGKSHGPNDARSRFVPWILAGPGIRKNFDLTSLPELQIHTEDTFATLCMLLGLATPAGIDGKPIDVVLEGLELLQNVPQ